MNRLTYARQNGIKTGYWLTAKKDELVQRLGKYEDTGLEPEEIIRKHMNDLSCENSQEIKRCSQDRWIPCDERLPEDDEIVLMQVSGKPVWNITLDNAFELGCYSEDEGWILEEYPECEKPKVIAWQPLPEPYRPEKGAGE